MKSLGCYNDSFWFDFFVILFISSVRWLFFRFLVFFFFALMEIMEWKINTETEAKTKHWFYYYYMLKWSFCSLYKVNKCLSHLCYNNNISIQWMQWDNFINFSVIFVCCFVPRNFLSSSKILIFFSIVFRFKWVRDVIQSHDPCLQSYFWSRLEYCNCSLCFSKKFLNELVFIFHTKDSNNG